MSGERDMGGGEGSSVPRLAAAPRMGGPAEPVRVVPAIGITLAGFIAVRAVVDLWLRQHFMAAVTHVYAMTGAWAPSGAAWQITAGLLTPGGARLTNTNGADITPNVSWASVPASCQAGPVLRCMEAAGYRQFVTYQPADRYWSFRFIEFGLFLVLAAALIAVTFAVISRRDA